MYVIADREYYLGKDFRGKLIAVKSKANALKYRTRSEAEEYIRFIPRTVGLGDFNWVSYEIEEWEAEKKTPEIKKFSNTTKTTTMEEENFDILSFFTNAVEVMSQIDRFIANMSYNEQLVDMKILDVRHYIRDNDHNLNAIQMQRLGYYLQELERERYDYKSKRLIASMFANDLDALKDKGNIEKITDVVTSKYRPKVLDDTDIEYIINKKKDAVCIA